MQWLNIICFILIGNGLLSLFDVRFNDFFTVLSRRRAVTLSDELNVLMGIPVKGFFSRDYEIEQILKDTGRADKFELVKHISLILFAAGAVLALLIDNIYMVPILGVGFSLAPIWYLRSTAGTYKKHLNEELETAISIITTSYLRTEDLIRSVKENLPSINEPVKVNFETFVYEAENINANLTSAINSLKMKIPNRVFHEFYYCCLYGNNENEVIIRHIDRDLVFESELIALEENFWHNHVLAKVPPPYTEDGDLVLDTIPELFWNSYCEIPVWSPYRLITKELIINRNSLSPMM